MVETPNVKPALIEYPESDGQPMSESDATRNYLVYCVEALRQFFASRPRVYISGNLFIYYQQGKPEKSFSPDVFVVFGVSKRERRTYKVWEEGGKVPSFALEITSMTTRKQDEEAKPALYARLGIQEYFQYDPTGDYLNPQLKGKRLVNGSYEPIVPETLSDGTLSLHSQTLHLDLRLLPLGQHSIVYFPELIPVGRSMRLFDPQTDEKLPTYQEAEQARQEAEQARQEAEQARQEAEQIAGVERQRAEQAEQVAGVERQRAEQAEQQMADLLEWLRVQGIDPDHS